MDRKGICILAAILIGAVGCAPKANAPEDVAAIKAMATAWGQAQTAGDAATLSAQYADDAVRLDPNASMLRTAIRKKHARRTRCSVEFVRAVGEFMPFRDRTFEYETVGLALRNFGDKSSVFSEAHRTLTNSGWLLSVDFVIPDNWLIRKVYMFHVFNVLPTLGRLVSDSWRRTLAYLAKSIQLSAPPTETCRMLSRHGFRRTFSEKITLGVVALVGGQK